MSRVERKPAVAELVRERNLLGGRGDGEPFPESKPTCVRVPDILHEKTISRGVEGAQTLAVTVLTPVIYAGAAGGGPGEFAASSDPNIANEYEMMVPGAKRIVAAVYQPYHNVPDMKAFALVDVLPHPKADGDILLRIASWPGHAGRVRIKITVFHAA